MTLRPQPLPIQFAGGVSTKEDSKSVPVTKLLTLENSTFVKQTTLAKRNGYAAKSRLIDGGSAEYGEAVGLASRADELLLFTADRAYSYRPSVDRWADTGEVASLTATESPIARTGTAQTMPDHATNRGVTVAAWEDSRGGVYCSVIEAGTGRILLAESLLDALGEAPRAVRCGTVLHVYWARPTTSRIYVAIVNPATPASSPATSILTSDLSSANPSYDACDVLGLYRDINPALIAWSLQGGGYRLGYVHPSGVLGSPVTGLPSVATYSDSVTGPIACTYDRLAGAYLFVAWCAALPHIRTVEPDDLSTSVASAAVSATSATWNRVTLECNGYTDAGLKSVWWAGEMDGASDDVNRIECGQVDETVAVVTAARTLRGHGLVSRAFFNNGHVYALVGHGVQFFPYVALVRLSGEDFGGVTQTYYRSVVGQFTGLGARKHLTSVNAIDPDGTRILPPIAFSGETLLTASDLAATFPTDHAFCISYRIQLDGENGDQFGESGIKLVAVEFDSDTAYQSVELGRSLYLASACQQHYDGLRWAEAGFHTAPDTASGTIATSQASGAGALPSATTFLYRAIYEEIDAQGELHRSAPCSPITVLTTGAATKITITLPAYRLTNKRRVRIGVFRSEGNAEGTIDTIGFYRVNSTDPNASTGDNRFVANDPTADTVTFVDNIADAVLTTREPLYTNGGILPNDASPMRGDAIAGGKSRLFWTDSTDGNVIRYSQERTDETGAEMPVALKLQTDPYGGRVIALGVMDGAVFALCETAIYGFGGPGPLAAPGAGNESFSSVDLITADCGCKSPNSICQSPAGIFFQSEKGIKLLGRDRQVIDVGADVYAYNDQLVTRATLLPDRSQVLFLVQSGLTLLYDYDKNAWSTFTNHEGLDARVVDGSYYYLRTDGRVFVETPGEYRDDNSHITMRIETAWIKMAGYLQGWQKILWAYFLGEWKSSHTLVVRYRLDYNAGYSTPVELDVDSNIDPRYYGEGEYGSGTYGNGTADTTRYQRAIHYNVPCQAIQFRIEDVESTDEFGASFELSELLLIGGVLDARAKIGSARTN